MEKFGKLKGFYYFYQSEFHVIEEVVCFNEYAHLYLKNVMGYITLNYNYIEDSAPIFFKPPNEMKGIKFIACISGSFKYVQKSQVFRVYFEVCDVDFEKMEYTVKSLSGRENVLKLTNNQFVKNMINEHIRLDMLEPWKKPNIYKDEKEQLYFDLFPSMCKLKALSKMIGIVMNKPYRLEDEEGDKYVIHQSTFTDNNLGEFFKYYVENLSRSGIVKPKMVTIEKVTKVKLSKNFIQRCICYMEPEVYWYLVYFPETQVENYRKDLSSMIEKNEFEKEEVCFDTPKQIDAMVATLLFINSKDGIPVLPYGYDFMFEQLFYEKHVKGINCLDFKSF